jgi:Leucine-rich repeat (LRR) protein
MWGVVALEPMSVVAQRSLQSLRRWRGSSVATVGIAVILGLTALAVAPSLAEQRTIRWARSVGAEVELDDSWPFAHLTQVSFIHTKISDVDLVRLNACPQLTVLFLSGCRISDSGITSLTPRHSLSYADLTDTLITDASLRHVARFTRLGTLVLRNTRVSDDGVQCLAALPELCFIDLASTDITDQSIVALSRVRTLAHVGLDTTNTGADHRAFEGFEGLRSLSMANTRLTDKTLATLTGRATPLRELFIDATSITDDGLAEARWPSSLASLSLTNTAVSDRGLSVVVRECPGLEWLLLDGTRVTDRGVARLGDLIQLRGISLSDTAVTDAAIESLMQCALLETVMLNDTRVTDRGVSKFLSAGNLAYLYLRNTSVTSAAERLLKERVPDITIER